METYGYVSKEVGPKKEKLKNAQATLAKKQAALQAARDQLAAVRTAFSNFLGITTLRIWKLAQCE